MYGCGSEKKFEKDVKLKQFNNYVEHVITGRLFWVLKHLEK